jgi:hypothetical protein
VSRRRHGGVCYHERRADGMLGICGLFRRQQRTLHLFMLSVSAGAKACMHGSTVCPHTRVLCVDVGAQVAVGSWCSPGAPCHAGLCTTLAQLDTAGALPQHSACRHGSTGAATEGHAHICTIRGTSSSSRCGFMRAGGWRMQSGAAGNVEPCGLLAGRSRHERYGTRIGVCVYVWAWQQPSRMIDHSGS